MKLDSKCANEQVKKHILLVRCGRSPSKTRFCWYDPMVDNSWMIMLFPSSDYLTLWAQTNMQERKENRSQIRLISKTK